MPYEIWKPCLFNTLKAGCGLDVSSSASPDPCFRKKHENEMKFTHQHVITFLFAFDKSWPWLPLCLCTWQIPKYPEHNQKGLTSKLLDLTLMMLHPCLCSVKYVPYVDTFIGGSSCRKDARFFFKHFNSKTQTGTCITRISLLYKKEKQMYCFLFFFSYNRWTSFQQAHQGPCWSLHSKAMVFILENVIFLLNYPHKLVSG